MPLLRGNFLAAIKRHSVVADLRPFLTFAAMDKLTSYLEQFEEFLAKESFDPKYKNLYDPVDYTLSNAGKRLRPLVVMMACEAYSGQTQTALPAAKAIELFHNFTLLHDDVMDDAPLRRGKDSVYRKFGLNSAILSGDVMLILSYDCIKDYDPPLYKWIMQVINENAIKVCEGQQLDIDFETREDVSIQEYLLMIELKTAVLFGGALKIGALIGGASKEQSQHLYEFGKNVGIAFQMQDDILDTYGDNPKVGKQKGGDILQCKKTYLYLKTMDLLEGEEKMSFQSLYDSDEQNKVSKVIEVFDRVVIKEYTEQVKQAYLDLAWSHLDACGLHENQKALFVDFGNFLLKREY